MGSFDPNLWQTRAWERYQNSLALGHDKLKAIARWDRDHRSVDGLGALVGWCTRHGIDVRFDRHPGATYYSGKKLIRVNNALQPEKQLFFLLHECGHHLIGDHLDDDHERLGMDHSQLAPDVRRTLCNRVDVVDEEFEAWRRGARLSKRLGLVLDRASFEKVKAQSLRTYFQWTLDPGPWKVQNERDDDDEETVA